MILDITNSELFDSLLEISYENCEYDLHNDFSLKYIDFNKAEALLKFDFHEIDGKKSIHLIFKNVDPIILKLPFQEDTTIDNFHRGRYEYQGQLYDEFEGKRCFYMEFYDSGDCIILCSEAIFKIDSKTKVLNLKQ